MMRPVGFISLEIREGGVRGGRDHEMLQLEERLADDGKHLDSLSPAMDVA